MVPDIVGLDAREKVTCLLYRIQTDTLDAVKANIMQDSELRRDFERCVTFYKYFIKQSSGNQSKEARRVAEVGSHRNCNNEFEYRYYSKEEDKKLSDNSKEKIWKLYEGRPPSENLEEEMREEFKRTKISDILSKRRRSCSTPSRR